MFKQSVKILLEHVSYSLLSWPVINQFQLFSLHFGQIGLSKQWRPKIRLLLFDEQSDQRLHCLLVGLHFLEAFLFWKEMIFFNVGVITAIYWVSENSEFHSTSQYFIMLHIMTPSPSPRLEPLLTRFD